MEIRIAILQYAESRDSFRFTDLLAYLNSLFEISKVTLSWYLRQLVNESMLFKLGRGIYTSHGKVLADYQPHVSKRGEKIAKGLRKEYPIVDFSVFDGENLAVYQHHHSTNNTIYVEVERDALEPVFHFLKKEGYKVHLNPSKDFVYDNIDLADENVIVKPLVTESPLAEYNGVKTPRIEKILVDVLCDADFDYLQGMEWRYMMENAFGQVAVNRSSMLRYASRRNAKDKVAETIKEIDR
mgnify:CR=1 FL=1